jgi:hypothetical protein
MFDTILTIACYVVGSIASVVSLFKIVHVGEDDKNVPVSAMIFCVGLLLVIAARVLSHLSAHP